ncbi:YigZ family protein [Haloimpatiens lingqiaonensis]|uniref:YigZ family protein n=1 Tax=Haloimpatiens lingqiaonensis TaxID=1380675 RepID=UPI0010FD6B93|nr:YigZ family protein [Haloimpatiens lingqiaonensis]
MGYLTIKHREEERFYEKKSEFIGYVKRVESEEEAKEFIGDIKNMHKQATHNVYAYVIGENMGIQRYSDDGEPQGTAGIPVLEVIKKNNVSDCAVVVTRYFGGILLGAGGLVRAYSKAASMAIQKGGIVEKVKGMPIEVIIDYDMLGKLQYTCEQNAWYIEEIIYTDKVTLLFYFEIDTKEQFEKRIIDITGGKVIIEERDENIFFKKENRLYLVC